MSPATIQAIDPIILRTPPGLARSSSQMTFNSRNSLLVRITSSDGLVGWGEGGQWGPPEPAAIAIRDVLGPRLLGRRVSEPSVIWADSYAFSRDFGQKGTYIEALSAIDIALWDVWGQALGVPIYALLGGAFRDDVGVYASGGQYDATASDLATHLQHLSAEVTTWVGQGFDAIKIKIGGLSVKGDLARVREARRLLGPDRRLMVDANHAYTSSTALTVGRVLDQLDITWFEEPVVPEDRDGYRRVRDGIQTPVAGGEAEFTRFGFRDLLCAGGVDVVQPDTCACGGFTEIQAIKALASAFSVLLVPHIWGSGVALAAGLQVLATIPPTPYTEHPMPFQNEPVAEFDTNPNPLRDDLLVDPPTIRDGRIAVPGDPGLGIALRDDVIAKYAQPI